MTTETTTSRLSASKVAGTHRWRVYAGLDSATAIPTTGEKVEGAPYTVVRDWGTFTLADRIAAKLKAGEPINYAFSYQATGIPLFSPQYAAGAEMGCKMGNEIYPLNCSAIVTTSG